ncbi:MAG TPA: nitrogenase component 1 [Desulfosporosinus sp.]|nr:nitrogenase component 1 [Desulfosporosinus sp.]
MFNNLYHIGQFQAGVKHIKNAKYIVTNIDENDVINGGEKKLAEAVIETEKRYSPNVIFVLTSCASGIIGDDVDAVVGNVQKEVKATVVPIHCEGFKSKLPATGFEAAFNAIKHYILKDIRPPREEGLINLFAPTSVGIADQKEIKRLLEHLGLHVNYVPFYSNVEKIKTIPAAIASASICEVFADEFMQWLNTEYDIPYAITCMPLGVKNTDQWLRGIAKLVGKVEQVEEYIEREHQRILPQIEEVRGILQGKRAVVSAGTARGFAATALIEDYGLELIGLRVRNLEEAVEERVGKLVDIHGEDFFFDISFGQTHEQVNYVRKLNPDIFIGNNAQIAKLGIPTEHVLDPIRPTMGYDGILYIGRKLANAIQNPGFIKKTAQHAELPYQEGWYSENPFKYHTN